MTDSDLRELDGWIAEHLFKGERISICYADDHSMDDFSWCYDCRKLVDDAEQVARRFSSNPTAFSLVKREMERRGWDWELLSSGGVPPEKRFRFVVALKVHSRVSIKIGEAASEELAGCLAVKAAVMANSSSTPA